MFIVKASFQQVYVASSLSKTQASLVLHSFIATFPGSNITRYSGLNIVAKYMNHQNIIKVFFRADSGFFSGRLFDTLESFCWDYLVKVKLKNLEKLLQAQIWLEIKGKLQVTKQVRKELQRSLPSFLNLKKSPIKDTFVFRIMGVVSGFVIRKSESYYLLKSKK